MTRAPRARGSADAGLLSEAEVQRLLLACSERAPTGVRNRALIALLYCAGLRVGEVLALAPRDLDLGAGTVAVRGARARTAHVFPAAHPYLETWLALRERLGLPAQGELFCTLKGARLAAAYVRAMFARLGERAGVEKRVHAHLLRHSCAARLARSGLAADALATQLGHAEPRSAGRSLAGYGVELRTEGSRCAAEIRWSLAPEPGAVKAIVWCGERAPRMREAPPSGGVRVRRWRPDEL